MGSFVQLLRSLVCEGGSQGEGIEGTGAWGGGGRRCALLGMSCDLQHGYHVISVLHNINIQIVQFLQGMAQYYLAKST